LPLMAGTLIAWLSSLVEMLFYSRWFQRISLFQTEPERNAEPASVIICFRNELENLRKLIPALMHQDYPDYEVILVADRVPLKTISSLNMEFANFDRLVFIEIDKTPEGLSPKKFALQEGIRRAKNPVLLFTDADCLPSGNSWIRSMAGLIDAQTEIVLGLGNYRAEPGLLNKMIQYDTLSTACLYFGMALAGKPYMGVGRNLAYRKSLFEKAGGFESHKSVLSGDDDLFVNAAARKGRVKICFHEKGRSISEPEKNWASWLKQKLRHYSSGRFYKTEDRLRLALFHGSRSVFWIAGLWLCTLKDGYLVFFALTVFRLIYFLPPTRGAATRFGIHLPHLLLPVIDFLHCFLVSVLGMCSIFFPPRRWK